MNFYDDLASTALELIEEFGQTILLVRSGDSSNPVTGATTIGSGTNHKLSGVLKRYPDNLIDGTRIKSSDRQIVIGGTVEPLMTDKVRIKDVDWAIESIQTSNPAGTALVYFIQVSR